MKRTLDALKKKEKRLIVGMETGSAPGKLGAALIEVSGSGDDTVLYVRGFASSSFAPELASAVESVDRNGAVGSEDLAGINFLILHHLSKLYEAVVENAGVESGSVDLIGLSCIDAGPHSFPLDPAVLSQMTEHAVASHFRIGVSDGKGGFIPVEEALLQGMVGEMIDRFGLDEEVREAVTVALLANESIFNAQAAFCGGPAPAKKTAGRTTPRAAKGKTPIDTKKAFLCGEFFFPA